MAGAPCLGHANWGSRNREPPAHLGVSAQAFRWCGGGLRLASQNGGDDFTAGELIFSRCRICHGNDSTLVFLDTLHCNTGGSIHLLINLPAATAAPDSLPILRENAQRFLKIRVIFARAS